MLEDFNVFVSRHGEVGMQALLENWERYQGIPANHLMPLEARWDRFIKLTNDCVTQAVA
ncbi:MAG: hypothetical protein AB7S81_05290 [Bdellovibrionales bacterium]|jgi:hypothetical protein